MAISEVFAVALPLHRVRDPIVRVKMGLCINRQTIANNAIGVIRDLDEEFMSFQTTVGE